MCMAWVWMWPRTVIGYRRGGGCHACRCAATRAPVVSPGHMCDVGTTCGSRRCSGESTAASVPMERVVEMPRVPTTRHSSSTRPWATGCALLAGTGGFTTHVHHELLIQAGALGRQFRRQRARRRRWWAGWQRCGPHGVDRAKANAGAARRPGGSAYMRRRGRCPGLSRLTLGHRGSLETFAEAMAPTTPTKWSHHPNDGPQAEHSVLLPSAADKVARAAGSVHTVVWEARGATLAVRSAN